MSGWVSGRGGGAGASRGRGYAAHYATPSPTPSASRQTAKSPMESSTAHNAAASSSIFDQPISATVVSDWLQDVEPTAASSVPASGKADQSTTLTDEQWMQKLKTLAPKAPVCGSCNSPKRGAARISGWPPVYSEEQVQRTFPNHNIRRGAASNRGRSPRQSQSWGQVADNKPTDNWITDVASVHDDADVANQDDEPELSSSPKGGFARPTVVGKGWTPAMQRHFEREQEMKMKLKKEEQADAETFSQGFGGFEAKLEAALKEERNKWTHLPPVEKQFYEEHPEVTAMFLDEVAQLRKEKNDITVSDLCTDKNLNRTIPFPIFKFEHVWGNYPEILSTIRENNFTDPSPIQCQMWPVLMLGYDCIGIAQTGSGKTLGFLLPAFVHIDRQPTPRDDRDGPTCLVLTPTRELALQIAGEVKKYHYRGIKSLCVYGGGCRVSQVDLLSKGVDIVIATPGRLNDLVLDGKLHLSSISYLVLDEADRMLDMGFEPQIRGVLTHIRPDRHTVMTSATWPPGVRKLAEHYMNNPMSVVIGSLDLSACKDVEQLIQMIEAVEKSDRLLDILDSLKDDPTMKTLIFVARKATVPRLAQKVSHMGVRCDELHGDREQADRESTLADFRRGRIRTLIATDVASRGLDVTDITHVINYDFPKNMEEYVHRVGRTGRAGRKGTSITFFTRDDWRNAGELITILEKNNQLVPDELVSMAERFREYEQRRADDPNAWRNRNKDRMRSEKNVFVDPFTGEAIGTSLTKD